MLFKRWVTLLIWLCLGLTIAILFLFVRLPDIVESQIKQRLPQFLDPATLAFEIENIGISNAHVSNIRVGRGLSIDAIAIDYDIRHLPSVHVGTVSVSGLTVHALLDENNQIKLQGLEWPSASTGAPSDPEHLSFLPDKMVFRNAKILIKAVDDEFLIPFDGKAILSVKDQTLAIQATGYLFGEKLETRMVYDMNTGLKSFRAAGNAFDLEHLNALIAKKTDTLRLTGPLDFVVESSAPKKKWKMNFSMVQFTHPVPAAIESVFMTLTLDTQTIKAAGQFDISCKPLPATRMGYIASIDLNKAHLFEVQFKNTTTGPCSIETGLLTARVKKPRLTARFSGTPSKGRAKIFLKTGQGSIQHQEGTLAFSDGEVRADMTADFTAQGRGISSTLLVTANKLKLQSDSMASSFASVTASGWAGLDKKKKPSGRMTIKASNGNLWSADLKTRASGIEVELPLYFPVSANTGPGRYRIPKIFYNNPYAFSTTGEILQTDLTKFQITGAVGFNLRPDIKTQYTASLGFEKKFAAHLAFETPPFHINEADLKLLIPQQFAKAEVDVTASVQGRADYTGHGLKTRLQIGIENGDLRLPELKVTAKGIHTMVTLNDLLAWETVPGQILTIDSIEADKIKLNDVIIRFSLEDARSLLVENLRFKWCNGLVSSEAIRFPQDTGEYALILYCDRLELSQLLAQVGAFDARGSGTLNGRIPLMYSDGNISFDNGFLFSTPGSGGKMVIDNTDRITAGIPMDSPQFAQLDLAREALKNYDYEWAKLVFHSFEDSLYLNMELDGKPSDPLPFVYEKKLGSFVRVDANSPGSRFQGIKLDVNLKLPFNQVMKFGNKLKSILQ